MTQLSDSSASGWNSLEGGDRRLLRLDGKMTCSDASFSLPLLLEDGEKRRLLHWLGANVTWADMGRLDANVTWDAGRHGHLLAALG